MEQVRACVGAQIGGADSAIDGKIQVELQKVFTPTGRIKTGRDAAPQMLLRAERDRLIEAQATAQSLLDDFDLCSTGVKNVFKEICDLALRKQELVPQQELLRQLAREYTQIQNDRNQRLAEKNAAEHGQRAIRERVGNIGRYRNDVSTMVESAEAELKREAVRTDALALLSRTFSEARTEMLGAVACPIESAATKYLEQICGRRRLPGSN